MPWLVLGARRLHWSPSGPTPTWVVFGCGALAYASGHGIHLAANAVNNATPGQTAHLWDETVGHAIWYTGVALVVVALARTMAGHPRPPLVGYLLAVGVGVTWATNSVGTDNLVLQSPGVARRGRLGGVRLASPPRARLTLLVGFVPRRDSW